MLSSTFSSFYYISTREDSGQANVSVTLTGFANTTKNCTYTTKQFSSFTLAPIKNTQTTTLLKSCKGSQTFLI